MLLIHKVGENMSDSVYEDVVKTWKEMRKNTEDDYNGILDKFWILNTQHSNNIENGMLTQYVVKRVFDGASVSMARIYPTDIIEAQNSKFAKRKVIRNLLNESAITQDLIKSLHSTYMNNLYDELMYNKGERPGQFKIHDYVTGIEGNVGSLPENVSREIEELCDELVYADENNILEVAAYFHTMFETIHPFADGNGRVGRLVMNYLLMLYNHPPINIFAEEKNTYYLAFTVFEKTGEISGLVKFLKEQCVLTWVGK